jgi:26S proteasome regulatory subunit T1
LPYLCSALGEEEIAALKSYNMGPYSEKLRQVEKDIEEAMKNINTLCGVKESDTGLAPPALWDLAADKMAMSHEQPLQVLAELPMILFRTVARGHAACPPPL